MSFFISPTDVTAKGDEVTTLGESIGNEVRSNLAGLDATTPGLRTPGEFAKLATVWTEFAITLSTEIAADGEAIRNCGTNHGTNDENQAGCFPR
ncbi:hypothetical protein LX16_1100 [Stackebrandtia albiflava]|uniref:Excreted virulence factor EspC (Type VII ESX diderm) n=1 Tax=Stackebrandtia albiflava TaxID=406432 RepID=A0A562VC46_9ACTN|nr:hypothetical protein [Stackebrandtia albiflava]TWJ15397.1 hypothetical protein LX16_1100 [Stackebrandtia albiflava]